MKRTLYFLAYILLFLGGIGWFSGFFDIPWADSGYEMPLGDLVGVAVDSSGNIYCGVRFYSRVQKYDPKGHFLFSLHIGAGGGAFRIQVNEKDELEVATARTNRLYRFSPEGELLEQRDDVHHFFADFGTQGERQCRGPENSVYQIPTALLFPSVVKISSSGQKTTVVSVPLYKWFVMGPFPAWLFWMVAILLLGGMQYLDKKKGNPQRGTGTDGENTAAHPGISC